MLIWDNIWASISSSHLIFCQALSVQRGEAVKQVMIRVVITTMMIVMTVMTTDYNDDCDDYNADNV